MTHDRGRISRRHFMGATAASVGIASLAGMPLRAYAAETYDLIIIGAGTAGIPCAISAAENGAKVLLVDKSIQLGGTLWVSGGSMAASGTRLQARKGIKDSPDLHYADIMRLGNGKADPAVTRRYVENAGPMADWLEDIGYQARPGEPVMGRGGHASFSAPRYFTGPERGRSLLNVFLPALRKHVDAGNVRILLSTSAAELVVARDKSVRGIIAVGESGVRTQISARKVLIASGGYCYSPEMFKRVTGYAQYASSSYYMSKGEGLLLGEAAGGFIRGGEHQVLGGAILNDRNYPSVSIFQAELNHERRPQWEVWVNSLGKRFGREDEPDLDLRDRRFTQQPTQRMWIVFDQEIADKAPPLIEGKEKSEVMHMFGVHPMLFKADSIEALARSTGIDAANLEFTLREYNAAVRDKIDPLGRKFLPVEVAKAPFYAIELSGGNIISFGGLAVDADMSLLRKDGSVIKNVYAAGEVIGLATIAGDSAVQGSGVTPSITFGRQVGRSVMTRA